MKKFWYHTFQDEDTQRNGRCGQEQWGYRVTYDNCVIKKESGFESQAEAEAAGRRKEDQLRKDYGMEKRN